LQADASLGRLQKKKKTKEKRMRKKRRKKRKRKKKEEEEEEEEELHETRCCSMATSNRQPTYVPLVQNQIFF
jgi:adenylate kinase